MAEFIRPKSDARACAVIEETGDGTPVGRCWFYVDDDGCCPRHGDVHEAQRLYNETGKLTPEHELPGKKPG